MAKASDGSTPEVQIDPEVEAALESLAAKRAQLKALGAPENGIPYRASIRNDKRVIAAALAAYRRVTGLHKRDVTGMGLWSLFGKTAGVVQSVDCMEGGILVLNNLAVIPEKKFTEGDWAQADKMIADGKI